MHRAEPNGNKQEDKDSPRSGLKGREANSADNTIQLRTSKQLICCSRAETFKRIYRRRFHAIDKSSCRNLHTTRMTVYILYMYTETKDILLVGFLSLSMHRCYFKYSGFATSSMPSNVYPWIRLYINWLIRTLSDISKYTGQNKLHFDIQNNLFGCMQTDLFPKHETHT